MSVIPTVNAPYTHQVKKKCDYNLVSKLVCLFIDPDSSSYVSSLPASACHLLEQQLDWDNGNDKDLIKIAYHMIEWEEKLSCHLGLTEVDVYDIKHNLRLTTPELLR